MKTFTLSFVVISSVLALTACGGNSSNVSKQTVSNLVQPTNTNTAFDPTKINNDSQDPISGQHWLALISEKDAPKYTFANSNVGKDITKMTIGNQTFELLDTGSLEGLGDDTLGAGYGATAHSRFGVGWQDIADDRGAMIFFYQGYQTLPKDMPTVGTASYTGQAFHACEDCDNMIGKSSFDVNFGKKTLAGVIEHDDGKVNLHATISGSSFAGVANGVQTNGAFYGKDASELSGVYKETGGKFAGAFGATKAK